MTRGRVVLGALTLAAIAACSDSNVPFFTAPTSVPNSPVGIQNGVTGLFSATRLDLGTFVLDMAGYGRQYGNFTNTEPRFITYTLGINPTPNSWAAGWAQEYSNIAQAKQLIATLPQVHPAYTAAQLAAITGVVETLEALNYMYVVEYHDSSGMAVMQSTTATTPPPLYCLKDAWAYIVALLDTANGNLTLAGSAPLPVKTPAGFGAVNSLAAPSNVPGAFAAFNRALAGKAGLEYAYAIARSGGSAPTPTTPGAPDVAALTAADSDITHSALYDTTALAPTPAGQFAHDLHSVLHDFSAASGDQVNAMNAFIGTGAVLNDLVVGVDTIHDLRWKAKFGPNPNAVQQQSYNFIASPYIYVMYASPTAPIPIVRNEELTLVRAQIEIGLGHYPAALALINAVRERVGGPALTPLPGSTGSSYVSIRDALLKEQNISTALEGSYDRAISIRMYNLAAQLDTTWDKTKYKPDQHTTVSPLPTAEISGRGGSVTLVCP